MSLKAELKESMKSAMKAKEQIRLDTIRSLLSAIQYEEMQKQTDELSEDDTIVVIKRELKKRHEELEFANKANRSDLKEKLLLEINTVDAFLPKQLSVEELERIISVMKDSTPGLSLGIVMKTLKDSYAGQYDAKLASDIARKLLG